jgi:hypothetical protein
MIFILGIVARVTFDTNQNPEENSTQIDIHTLRRNVGVQILGVFDVGQRLVQALRDNVPAKMQSRSLTTLYNRPIALKELLVRQMKDRRWRAE